VLAAELDGAADVPAALRRDAGLARLTDDLAWIHG
jgi:hypothetical protein